MSKNYYPEEQEPRTFKHFLRGLIVAVIAVLILLTIVDICSPSFGFVRKVPTGTVAVVTNFGKIEDETKEPGLTITGEYFAHYTCLSTRTQKVSSNLVAFSKDMQEVDIQMVVNYNVTADTAVKLFKEVGEQYEDKIIIPTVTESCKVVFAKYTAEELITNRGILADEIKDEIVNNLAAYNINISLVTINNIDFTDAFTDAVESKQVATQEKLKAQTEQEKKTIEAQAEAERKVIAAQAEADAVKAAADAEAYAIRTKAEAEAEANEKLAASITDELIDYNKINQWDGKLPETVVGTDTTTVIPIQ